MNSRNARFILAALVIFSAAIVLQARQRNEVFPSRLRLQTFPRQINAWSGTDITIDSEQLQISPSTTIRSRSWGRVSSCCAITELSKHPIRISICLSLTSPANVPATRFTHRAIVCRVRVGHPSRTLARC